MSGKEEFIEIFREKITRPGADALLDYLENKSDFFTSPASARYHGAYVGGLCEHSVNVYHCLREYLARERSRSSTGWRPPTNRWPSPPCSMTCARSAATRRAPAM
mgnify:CR=1 FL=1